MPDLSICIVNHNARELVLACLRSIYDKTKFINYEIIVVDNNSSDGSPQEIFMRDFFCKNYLMLLQKGS